MSRSRALLSWSSGKDCAFALHRTRQGDEIEVVGLFTSVEDDAGRVSMHGVRPEILHAQAAALGLPLWELSLPNPCPNAVYEKRMGAAVRRALEDGVTHFVFGDLYLEDVRAYRERALAGSGIQPVLPLSPPSTPALAQEMLDSGVCAHITCVDADQLDPAFAGRRWDAELISALPEGVDPCGENGEFHSVVFASPDFRQPLALELTAIERRGRFCYADFRLSGCAASC